MIEGVSPGRIEEILLLCTAPPEQVAYDGWLLRPSPKYADYARREPDAAFAISPLGGSTQGIGLEDKIDRCESMYEAAGLPPTYRIVASSPSNLDDILAERGYNRVHPTLVQVCRLSRPFSGPPLGLRFDTMLLEPWLEISAKLRKLSPSTIEAEFQRLHHGEVPGYCVIAYSGDEPVACGLVMHEQEFAGLFDIFVSAPHRGRGADTAISAHLLATARRMGAEVGWLSVVADNAPALRVYEKLGFETLYEYWYRVKA